MHDAMSCVVRVALGHRDDESALGIVELFYPQSLLKSTMGIVVACRAAHQVLWAKQEG